MRTSAHALRSPRYRGVLRKCTRALTCENVCLVLCRFSKVLSIVPLYRKCTRALTFEKVLSTEAPCRKCTGTLTFANAGAQARFAYDSYRRLLSMFGEVVLGIEATAFENELDAVREEMCVDDDSLLTGEHMQEVVRRFKNIYATQGVELPADVKKQLEQAVVKVFDSWDNRRSNEYRAINDIHDCSGTAVNVQVGLFCHMYRSLLTLTHTSGHGLWQHGHTYRCRLTLTHTSGVS